MSTRTETLNKANSIVNGARADQYGGPEDSFARIAALWSSYCSSTSQEVVFSTADVACMMALLKIARLRNSPDHDDSWVDLAGYAACGSEVSSLVEAAVEDNYDPVYEQKYRAQEEEAMATYQANARLGLEMMKSASPLRYRPG